ncbi:MAG: helix-turn-helix domain-containing protein [[Clostridium] symbiosum]
MMSIAIIYCCFLTASPARRCCGNVTQAAKKLGLQRQSLQYRIRKYGIYI